MTIEDLTKMHGRRPFEPFDLYLADGRKLPVEHPDFLARSPAGRTISVGLANGSHEIVDLVLVVSLKEAAHQWRVETQGQAVGTLRSANARGRWAACRCLPVYRIGYALLGNVGK